MKETDKNEMGPESVWTPVFTDPCVENAIRNKGCIRQSANAPFTISVSGEGLCSNYKTEALAVLTEDTKHTAD